MKRLALLLLLAILSVAALQAQARGFRSIQPIARPGPVPAGATPVTAVQPIDRALVERAVHDVASAWNSGELSGLLADDFASRSRLLDTVAEVVPHDATLTILGIQAVSTLEQYRQADGRRISTVSAVVRSQIEYNDPVAGFQRREGTGTWFFRVEDTPTPDITPGMSTPPLTAETGGGSDRPHITDVLPPSPSWDSMLTISGGNFGESGSAGIFLPGSSMGIPLRVETWSENALTGRYDVEALPDHMDIFSASFVGTGIASRDEPSSAVLWVCPGLDIFPYGDSGRLTENCAGKEITMQPLAEAITPEITGLFLPGLDEPATVYPGHTVQVVGRHFRSSPGSAMFEIDAREIPAEVSRWTDTVLDLALPHSVEGLLQQEGILRITNERGHSAETTISFVPRLEDRRLNFELSADCPTRPITRVVFNRGSPLTNGWTVVEDASQAYSFTPPVGEESDPLGLGVGCGFLTASDQPKAGNTSTGFRITCGCPALADRVHVSVSLRIRGPAGTPHH
jgi:hypothetical protein